MSKRLLSLPCIPIVAALALAACGSSDETALVEETIVASATANNPANCKRLNTQRFNEQLAGESGPGALAECEEEAEKKEGLDSVKVSKVEVDGSSATAEVALSGGGLDGQAVEVALVKKDDQWKLDEIVKFTKFDAGQLAQAFEAQVGAHPGEISHRLAACLTEAFASLSRSEAEDLRLSGSRDTFEELVEACDS
ncbi:MAG TPA: hypothetical protein VG898_01315 [Solirubrobacterales bacterium]|nr:hypothetical protein [Solirubrobacterales bacterium]